MEDVKEIHEKKEKKKFNIKSFIIKLLIILVLVIIYARYIGTIGLSVRDYGIYNSKLPSSFNGVKIVQLSDIHYGTVGKKRMEKIISKVNDIKPDIVVFTGDLYDNYTVITDDNVNELKELLNNINSNLGKYAIRGNHDYDYDYYDDIMNNSGFKILDSTSQLIYNNSSTPIELVGYPNYDPDYNIELTDNYKIGLIHKPDTVENILDKDFSLILAGHSHGGQIRIPYVGSLFNNEGSKNYKNRYYKINNTDFYINYGIGNSFLNFRLFNHPSINLYRLYDK